MPDLDSLKREVDGHRVQLEEYGRLYDLYQKQVIVYSPNLTPICNGMDRLKEIISGLRATSEPEFEKALSDALILWAYCLANLGYLQEASCALDESLELAAQYQLQNIIDEGIGVRALLRENEEIERLVSLKAAENQKTVELGRFSKFLIWLFCRK